MVAADAGGAGREPSSGRAASATADRSLASAGPRQVLAGGGEAGVEAQGRLELRGGFLPPSEREQHGAEVVAHRGVFWAQPRRLTEMREALFRPPQHLQGDAQVAARFRPRGIEADRLLEMLHRVRETARARQRSSHLRVRARQLTRASSSRPSRHRISPRLLCASQAAGLRAIVARYSRSASP